MLQSPPTSPQEKTNKSSNSDIIDDEDFEQHSSLTTNSNWSYFSNESNSNSNIPSGVVGASTTHHHTKVGFDEDIDDLHTNTSTGSITSPFSSSLKDFPSSASSMHHNTTTTTILNSNSNNSNNNNNINSDNMNNDDDDDNSGNNGRSRGNSKLSIYTDNLNIKTVKTVSPSPSIQTQQQQQDWFFIENVDFPVGTQLNYDEGNTLDYKLTIFSDYINFKTTNKEESQKLEKELIAENIGSLEKTPVSEHSHVQFVISPTTTATSTSSTNSESGVIDYAKLGERMTEYLIAYLNSNGGALIFGVRDDGVVMGMKLSEKQRDKIRLMFDNCIRNFQITPAPRVAIHYRLEFKKTTNVPSLWIMILEVKKSDFFHYAHIRSHLKSWERLSASNFCLCDRPQRFVERLRELRSTQEYQNAVIQIPTMSRRNSISSNNLQQQATANKTGNTSPKRMIDGYFTLVFSDTQLTVCETVLARAGFDKRIYRLESYCGMDEQGRFLVDRPSKFFKLIYQFLQIGYVSVKMYDWAVFKLEAEYYGLAELLDGDQTTTEKYDTFVILKMVKGTHIHTSISQASLSNKIGTPLLSNTLNVSNNALSFTHQFVVVVANGEEIAAEMGKIYQIDQQNSLPLNNNTMESATFVYNQPLPSFYLMKVFYEYPTTTTDHDTNFTFSISKFSYLRHFKFDANFTGQEKIFVDIMTLDGIFNRDVSQMNVTIIGSGEAEHVLSVQGDEYGKLTRNCRKLSFELNLAKAVSLSEGGNEFYLDVSPNDTPKPKEISLNEWIDVSYPSSYSLQTGNQWNRVITLAFPKQQPICDGTASPQFELAPASNVNPKDIADTRYQNSQDELVVLRAYMFYDAHYLEKLESTFSFWYQFDNMKDINGNEVKIQANSITCGSTIGSGYQFGTVISPIIPSSDNDGQMVCDMSNNLLFNNSLIIVYGNIKKTIPPKPFISTLADGTKLSGSITSASPVYLIAQTHDDSCITFDGTVSGSPLAIYALQQKSNINNPTLPTISSYTEKQIAQVGSNSIKFCSSDAVSKEIGSDVQQVVFLFDTTSNDTISTYKFSSSIQPYWRVPVIIGVCLAAAFVLVAVLLTALGFWLCLRKKKKYAYIDIQ
ncbi:predicted protein [Naegleria gruberi]|uniref:Predicted protein n=1 Tax=Naegleria gruberi TaxID=5762 RepID=D2VZ72_NAEGR|nr:uncharacterized protein NAEGRDRAFT_59651 [Naegleria gruberi]EFC37942.1 predicted protein [Naegleria gruberi]|eukprot:XP_002670686.1 predicted protein [Naegleria gruberi strain NEG-M]